MARNTAAGSLFPKEKPSMATPNPLFWPDDRLPPLEPGDHLSRPEFERRYEAMPHIKKAELIEGVVYMPSPVRQRRHGRPHGHLVTWLGVYEATTPGVEMGDNTTARLDLTNEPQPDALLLIDPARGGQAHISADDYIEGAPEWIAEVAASSVSIDLNAKLAVYQRNGVLEYVVWRVLNRAVDWFVLRDGQFERLAPDAHGILRSTVFPGLWLDAAALVRGDLATVLAVLQQGLASPEHAAFVARLNPPTNLS
jgi:Uma2 family endonuclease